MPAMGRRFRAVGRLMRGGSFAAVGALLLCLLAALFFVESPHRATYMLRMTAGDPLSRRHAIAESLVKHLPEGGRLKVVLAQTRSSDESLRHVSEGHLDVALVQGAMPPYPHVQEVAPLVDESLHLLVRTDPALGLEGLRGQHVNLGEDLEGARGLATDVLRFVGFEAGRDYIDDAVTSRQLELMPVEQLPAATFVVSSLPSRIAAKLIRERGYRLVELPIGRALAMRTFGVATTTIPAYTYSYDPAVPPTDITTPGSPMLLVANAKVPRDAIRLLLDAVYDPSFIRDANLLGLTSEGLGHGTQYPLHAGTISYLERNRPILTSDSMSWLENLRSFIVSSLLAVYLAFQWWARRKALGFETFLAEVTAIERAALDIEVGNELDPARLYELRRRLTAIKAHALDAFAGGSLKDSELMNAFLTHATDVRTYLTSLIHAARVRQR
jgi:TRAP-type uncharacterized transport system substrate-binding protein